VNDRACTGGPYVVALNPLGAVYAAIVHAVVVGIQGRPTALELARWEGEGGALAPGDRGGSRT
jgi:hypothetical protein